MEKASATGSRAKRRQKPPPRKGPLYTPKAKQARILAASFAGKSQRQIAREVVVDRETVNRVLSQSEVQAKRKEGGPTRTRTWDQRIMSSGKPVDSKGNQQVKSADREQVRQNPQPGRNQIPEPTDRDDDDDSKKEESD